MVRRQRWCRETAGPRIAGLKSCRTQPDKRIRRTESTHLNFDQACESSGSLPGPRTWSLATSWQAACSTRACSAASAACSSQLAPLSAVSFMSCGKQQGLREAARCAGSEVMCSEWPGLQEVAQRVGSEVMCVKWRREWQVARLDADAKFAGHEARNAIS